VKFENVEEGVTVAKQIDEVTGSVYAGGHRSEARRQGAQQGLRPQVRLFEPNGEEVKMHGSDQAVTITFQVGAIINVFDGQTDFGWRRAGALPQESAKTRDITGGLPRVAELFEARTPKDAGMLAEFTGTMSFGKDTKGKQRLVITDLDGETHEYLILKDKHVLVHDGQVVNKGESIVDGAPDPHDILRLLGVEALAIYITDEVQDVYRLQGVKINDKHIEVIVRQMLRRVNVLIRATPSSSRASRSSAHICSTRTIGCRRRQAAGNLRASCCWDHQGLLVHRFVHFGGVLPGNDARVDRSGDHGQARRVARPQGERHRRSSDPGGYRSCLSQGTRKKNGRRGYGAGSWLADDAEVVCAAKRVPSAQNAPLVDLE
jgi:hypothetical protein